MERVLIPGERCGCVRVPASKSQAHRLLICAALGEKPVTVVCDSLSDDINATIDCLCALGAAMFAATAAGVYDKVEDAIDAMNSGFSKEYVPDPARGKVYSELYKKYTTLGNFTERCL